MTDNAICISNKDQETSINEKEEQGKSLLPESGTQVEPTIKSIKLNNLMGIKEIGVTLSEGITVIHGENSTGKTAMLKALYCSTKPFNTIASGRISTKAKKENEVVNKIKNVFRPDNGAIGKIVNNKSEEKLRISVQYLDANKMELAWGKQASEHIEMLDSTKNYSREVVYIPPKEIISASENFMALYKKFEMAFEETYYDLLELLNTPELKNENNNTAEEIRIILEGIIGGRITKKDSKYFIINKNGEENEMGLLSEGYRKIAILLRLINNGSLRKGSLLLWDEPEANMNPKMIKPLVDVMVLLVKMGVQIVIASHDYFIQQEIQLRAEYPDNKGYLLPVCFVSLYHNGDEVLAEQQERAYNLKNNAIMDEFDNIYDREQELIRQ